MRKIVLITMILGFSACAEKVVEPPENLIPEEQMVDILHDLALLNATKTSFAYIMEQNDVNTMDFLFGKYQIDSIQWAESNRYYASIPLQYQIIYEQVEAKLEAKRKILEENNQKRNDSARAAQQKRSDSLKNLQKVKPSS